MRVPSSNIKPVRPRMTDRDDAAVAWIVADEEITIESVPTHLPQDRALLGLLDTMRMDTPMASGCRQGRGNGAVKYLEGFGFDPAGAIPVSTAHRRGATRHVAIANSKNPRVQTSTSLTTV